MTPVEGILWLTLNCYKEAAHEPFKAQVAVSHIVINRSNKCKTDYKTEILRNKQFSWTIQNKFKWKEDKQYLQCFKASYTALNSPDITNGAEFYHLKKINPKWASKKIRIKNDFNGSHYFYKDNDNKPDYCNFPVYNNQISLNPSIKISPDSRKITMLQPASVKIKVEPNEDNTMLLMFLYLVNQL